MLKRDKGNGVLGGVCAGISKSFGIPVAVVRLVFVVGLLFGTLTFWLYLLLWLLLSVDDGVQFLDGFDQIRRDPNNAVIAGVCGAVATYAGCNPLVVRLLWLFCTLWLGFGVIPYIILWICIPQKTS